MSRLVRAAVANPLRREWGLEGKLVVGYSGNLGRVHEFAMPIAVDRWQRLLAGVTQG